MTAIPIYKYVKDKLITHGVENTSDGQLTLSDNKLFKQFVKLERASRSGSFDAVQAAVLEIETYLLAIEKRQLMVFAYMYLRFSDFTPKLTKPDENLGDGRVGKSYEFERQVSDEEMLIGLWAKVKYEQEGEALLRVVCAATQ
ncbi:MULTISPECIES: hypothetical protein [unclassified Shimia]|uniref:hypothetical protein n=1 Tax=unclassified Shimia TaxID=2630038 RepID=UPI003102C59F